MVREQLRAIARRERILEAALAVFTRRGYRDAAMDEIAVEAETSKGGLYFHFPNKQSLFFTLLDRMADLLMSRAEQAVAAERDPARQIDAALAVVLRTFSSHRALARLFLVDALGAGPEAHLKLMEIHRRFADLIARHLEAAIAAGAIPPLDTRLASMAWFGAINEVVTNWVLTGEPERLEDAYPQLRVFLRRSVGLPELPEDA